MVMLIFAPILAMSTVRLILSSAVESEQHIVTVTHLSIIYYFSEDNVHHHTSVKSE